MGGAKTFFEQKANALNHNVADKDRAYHDQVPSSNQSGVRSEE